MKFDYMLEIFSVMASDPEKLKKLLSKFKDNPENS